MVTLLSPHVMLMTLLTFHRGVCRKQNRSIHVSNCKSLTLIRPVHFPWIIFKLAESYPVRGWRCRRAFLYPSCGAKYMIASRLSGSSVCHHPPSDWDAAKRLTLEILTSWRLHNTAWALALLWLLQLQD